MYTILRCENGHLVDGLVLSASPDLIRLILRRQGDTSELRRVFGQWVAEDGSTVELESIMAGDHTDLGACIHEVRPSVLAAN